MKKDTIYREDAIDYFVTNVGFHDEDGHPIEDSDELRKIWTEYFDGIPSAQPEPCEDAVSRRLMYELGATCMARRDENGELVALGSLDALPSAQPDIIHCRDCEFTDGEKPIADGRYWCVLHGSFMYFCSDAERRTDG